MDALFGVPMNSIMVALLIALGLSLGAVGYVVLRSRIMFVMGLRNIPRRKAQTVLIILGLMLSTLIISAAFTTGDTVDYSITNQAVTTLGHIDEVVQAETQGDDRGSLVAAQSAIPGQVNQRFRAALEATADPSIDGYLPLLQEQVPVINARSRQSEASITFAGVDAEAMDGFPDVVSTASGQTLPVAALAEDEAYMNESAAEALAAQPGDRVQVYVQNQPYEFTIVDVVEDRVVTGVGGFEADKGMVTRLDTLQGLFQRPGEVDFIAISNRGDTRGGLPLADEVIASVEGLIATESLNLGIDPTKRDAIDEAEEAGNFMATFFLLLGLFSIAAGMLLILMIFVMLAAERKSEMGMARAVGTKRGHLVQMFMSEGMAYNLLAAMVGAALGILVSFGMARIMARLFSEFDISIQTHFTLRSLVISYSLGVTLTFVTVTFASWRTSKLNIVRAIRDIPEPTGGRMGWRWLAAALVGVGLGALLLITGIGSDLAFPFALGFSLMIGGAAVVLRFLGLEERPVFGAMGLLLLVIWGLVGGGRLEFLFGPLEGDIEMFFLSGVAMVTASTFLLIYNSDVILPLLSRVGGLFGTVLPALRTAVAYPLANKFRTGMTLAMISLVVFSLSMMSTMNYNFDRLFLADSSRGGWDVLVEENPNNPIDDLAGALRQAGSTAPDDFRALGKLSVGGVEEMEVRQGDAEYDEYPVQGVDEAFVRGGSIPLDLRARGFESDEAVWQALTERDDVALIDAFALESFGPGFGWPSFTLSGIAEGEQNFEPVSIEIHDSVSGESAEVEVIGVIGTGASANFLGIYLPEGTFRRVFGEPELSFHYVGLNDPDTSGAVAKEVEASLLTAGVQATSLKEKVDDEQALSRGFFYLMQAFMGMGLFVGIAAVGVIAFRSVVERRQQIGMLRAIGYRKNTVALSFILESSFVTLLGIASGVGLAIWLSFFLLTSDQFPTESQSYAVPWEQLVFITLFAYAASLVMTFIPSRQAASIPVAEALRYE